MWRVVACGARGTPLSPLSSPQRPYAQFDPKPRPFRAFCVAWHGEEGGKSGARKTKRMRARNSLRRRWLARAAEPKPGGHSRRCRFLPPAPHHSLALCCCAPPSASLGRRVNIRLHCTTDRGTWTAHGHMGTWRVRKPRQCFFLALASDGCKLRLTRPWLGLIYLTRIPSGAFLSLGEVHTGSEMASQNDQNKGK